MTINIAPDYCGQKQPHDAHPWHTPPIYGAATIVTNHQCAGLSNPVEPGLCWHDPGITWPNSISPRCELRAGHAGAHECDRGSMGGTATWTDGAIA